MPPDRLAIYLDENHCNNPRVLAVLRDAGVQVEKHLDHFSSGTLDEVWLPFVGYNGWILLTSDGRIRYRSNEKQAVIENNVRMFYFSNNNMSGEQMATALGKALPKIFRLARNNSRHSSRQSPHQVKLISEKSLSNCNFANDGCPSNSKDRGGGCGANIN